MAFEFFGFGPTIVCKLIVKILHNNDMAEVKKWYPWKIVQCDNNFGPPTMCFHPNNLAVASCAFCILKFELAYWITWIYNLVWKNLFSWNLIWKNSLSGNLILDLKHFEKLELTNWLWYLGKLVVGNFKTWNLNLKVFFPCKG